jgi:hypothetical protein
MIGAAIAGANALFGLGTGVYQMIKAHKMQEGLVDPTYQIPQSQIDALNLAKQQTQSRSFVGQNELENKQYANTASSTSNILKASTSGQDALAALTGINANNSAANNDMAYFAAQDYQNRLGSLKEQQGIMAGYEDKKQERDVYDRFYRTSAAISALKEGGMRNIKNTLNATEGAATYYEPLIRGKQ